MRKALIRLMLGRNKDYLNVIKLKGKIYEVKIQPFVSASEELKKWESAFEEAKAQNH